MLQVSMYSCKYSFLIFAIFAAPAHVEMMGLIGMGNNPMVGATVACAVAVYEGLNK